MENTKSFARGWKPRWSTKIYHVAEVSHGTVIDTEGKEASTKEILPVPADTAPLQPPDYLSNVNQARADAMQPYADALAKTIAGRPDVFQRTAATELRRKQPGLNVERKKQRIQTFPAFLQLFPQLFRIENNKVTARRQPTLAARPPPQPQRRLAQNARRSDELRLVSVRPLRAHKDLAKSRTPIQSWRAAPAPPWLPRH